MEFLGIAILPILGGILLYYFTHAAVRAPGVALSKKFVALGNLKGKTYSEIVSACGAPNSTSAAANGKLCQWMATGYHIALLFDENDICQGITHNSAV